jgi:protein-L-isoaspartate(D-aspartate) O-methyltransferase
MEATPGIEPGYAVLQTAASPLRHVAGQGPPYTSRGRPRQSGPRQDRDASFRRVVSPGPARYKRRTASNRIRLMPDYATQRLNMVEAQVRANDVTDTRIHAAMREVPREIFVPAAKRGVAYADSAIEIVRDRYLLEPRTFAKLLQLAEVRPTDSVLDIACGTGYSTAVIARLARTVIGLEQDADLVRLACEAVPAAGAKNAVIAQGAFVEGMPAKAPFDAIFVNGAVETIPDNLLAQLGEGGRLVAVVHSSERLGRATLFLREHGRIGRRVAFDAAAPALVGFRNSVGFVF